MFEDDVKLQLRRTEETAGSSLRGNQELLTLRVLALFCSARCPADLILRAYDFVSTLQGPGLAIVGGFHTPIEKECLRLLLRRRRPVVICPARSVIHMRLPADWQAPLVEGRLLLASPFSDGQNRITHDRANRRNRFVSSLADEVLVIHAAPGSKTLDLCREIAASGKNLLTFDSPHNANLIALGGRTIDAGPDLFSPRQ